MSDNNNQDDKSKEFTYMDSAEDVAKNNLDFDNDENVSMMADSENKKSEKKPGKIKIIGKWLLAGFLYAISWIIISSILKENIIMANSLSFDAKYLILFLSFPLISSIISLIFAHMAFGRDYALWDSTLFYTLIFGGFLFYILTISAYGQFSNKFASDITFNVYCMGCGCVPVRALHLYSNLVGWFGFEIKNICGIKNISTD